MRARIEHVTTAGTFNLDGLSSQVENNVWLFGDGATVLIVDASHDAAAIQAAVGDRRATIIACTHGHDDHINQAVALASATGAEVMLHPADLELWHAVHPHLVPDGELVQGQIIRFAGLEVRVIETPGHTGGSVSLYVPALEAVFAGDTLLAGGPGATGRSYSDFPTITHSINHRILSLPPQTRVLPGHGDETTVAAELQHVQDWVERGY
jgi:glyoxylase-like metal-dependent hydrolase (beta-lactamase superfamily II)